MTEASAISLPEGHVVAFEKKISDADVRSFAEASGDHNPLHLADAYASRTRFGRRIAHGMLTAGVVSAAIGNELAPPGALAIYLSQTLQFRRPVFIDDTIRAECTVTAFDPERNIATLKVECANQRGETVLRGEAQVLLEQLAT